LTKEIRAQWFRILERIVNDMNEAHRVRLKPLESRSRRVPVNAAAMPADPGPTGEAPSSSGWIVRHPNQSIQELNQNVLGVFFSNVNRDAGNVRQVLGRTMHTLEFLEDAKEGIPNVRFISEVPPYILVSKGVNDVYGRALCMDIWE
jgi:hypothetical protein